MRENLSPLTLRLARALPWGVRRYLPWLRGPTFTVGVSAVVLNDENRILLLRHRFRESRRWELPGGFVEQGEELEDSLRRELHEETGLEIEVLSLIGVEVSRSRHIDVSYLARVRRGALSVDESEILEAGFFAYTDLPPGLSREQVERLRAALE